MKLALLCLFAVFLQNASARRRRLPPQFIPPTMVTLENLATPCPKCLRNERIPQIEFQEMAFLPSVKMTEKYSGNGLRLEYLSSPFDRSNDQYNTLVPSLEQSDFLRELGYFPPVTRSAFEKLELPQKLPLLVKSARSEQLILPPKQVELPQGLGYLPSAVPYVATCFEPAVEIRGKCSGANIPVTSQNSCLALAAPINPELAPFIRSVIL